MWQQAPHGCHLCNYSLLAAVSFMLPTADCLTMNSNILRLTASLFHDCVSHCHVSSGTVSLYKACKFLWHVCFFPVWTELLWWCVECLWFHHCFGQYYWHHLHWIPCEYFSSVQSVLRSSSFLAQVPIPLCCVYRVARSIRRNRKKGGFYPDV